MLFSGAHGADLGALLGLNPPFPPQDLATSPPAENLLGATSVSLVFPVLLTTKMGRGMAFPHTRTSGNVLLQLGCKKWAVGGENKSFSELLCRSPMGTLCQCDSISTAQETSPERL